MKKRKCICKYATPIWTCQTNERR